MPASQRTRRPSPFHRPAPVLAEQHKGMSRRRERLNRARATLTAQRRGTELELRGAGRITGTTWLTGTTALFTRTVTLDGAGQRTNGNDSWGGAGYARAPRVP